MSASSCENKELGGVKEDTAEVTSSSLTNSSTPSKVTSSSIYSTHSAVTKRPKDENESEKEFICSPFYGRACRWAMLGEIKT